VRLISSELRYQNEEIDAEDDFLILKTRLEMEWKLISRYNTHKRLPGGGLVVWSGS
jgi:hypothetical protein